jgi:hypothetical protein
LIDAKEGIRAGVLKQSIMNLRLSRAKAKTKDEVFAGDFLISLSLFLGFMISDGLYFILSAQCGIIGTVGEILRR